jgi:hypothetical protein
VNRDLERSAGMGNYFPTSLTKKIIFDSIK